MTVIETAERSSFSRERLAGYDPERMGTATILIVGAGALAQPLVQNLALSGVGELRVVDFDEFESHNASRSIYYPTSGEQERLGLMKAKVVAHKAFPQMRAAEPVMRYALVPLQELGLGAFDGVDVVLSAVDNPRARAYISDACRFLGIAMVEGGFDGPTVSMSCFRAVEAEDAEDEPCYRCSNPHVVGTFSCQRYAAEASRQGIIAAIQPAASALAGLMAEAAIQALHGSHPASFKRTTLDVRSGEFRRYGLTRNSNCPGIHERNTYEPIDVGVGPDEPLEALIEAAEVQLGPGTRIDLAEPFVVEAFCLTCGTPITVESPEWSYDMSPRCTALDCGGSWRPVADVPDDFTPLKPIRLDSNTESRILELAATKAGFVAMNFVYAHNPATGQSAVLKLQGEVNELYSEVVE